MKRTVIFPTRRPRARRRTRSAKARRLGSPHWTASGRSLLSRRHRDIGGAEVHRPGGELLNAIAAAHGGVTDRHGWVKLVVASKSGGEKWCVEGRSGAGQLQGTRLFGSGYTRAAGRGVVSVPAIDSSQDHRGQHPAAYPLHPRPDHRTGPLSLLFRSSSFLPAAPTAFPLSLQLQLALTGLL